MQRCWGHYGWRLSLSFTSAIFDRLLISFAAGATRRFALVGLSRCPWTWPWPLLGGRSWPWHFLFFGLLWRSLLMTHTQKKSLINSLAPGRFQFNIRYIIFKLTLGNGGWGISYEIALRWMPQDLTDDKSTLVQVMAWCRQATSHYLSQCWPRSMSPNGVTRPQWVKPLPQTGIELFLIIKILNCLEETRWK